MIFNSPSMQQPQLVIDDFSRSHISSNNNLVNHLKKKSSSHQPNRRSRSQLTEINQERNEVNSSSLPNSSKSFLEDMSSDLTNFELLSLKKVELKCKPRRPRSSSSFNLITDLDSTKLTSISSSSTNSMYTSGEDLSDS